MMAGEKDPSNEVLCFSTTTHTHTYHSHCCGPAPGAGRRSQVPQTDGSTISHSLTDGPVYSEREKQTLVKINKIGISCLLTGSQTELLANASRCHNWLYSSSRPVPKALGGKKSIKKGLKAFNSLIK